MRTLALLSAALLVASPVLGSDAVRAGTLEKIRAQGYVQCGSVSRPGLAADEGNRGWSGLEVQLCRALAIAALGPDGHFTFHTYGSPKDFDSLRAGADQVAFLSFSEIAENRLTDRLVSGPTVFVETHDLLVAADSSARQPSDLAGQSICFYAGSPANASLDAFFESRKISIVRFAMQEYSELYDTFRVQRCQAMIGETTELADARLDRGANNLQTRFLPQHLKSFPIFAATPLAEDARWAAIVAWTMHTLMAADAPETQWQASGLRAMHIEGEGLGLAADWQANVVRTVGSYSEIFRRTLGADSPLKLDQGLNAPVASAGVLLAPATD